MIKPVTFQGVFNFKANLYALEVMSRFIEQSKANGYYKGYGNELNATIVDNTIQIGTGAFVVQGRMGEIENTEVVNVAIENGKVGYVCLRIETYHPSDEENCTLVVKTGTTFASINLTQEDTYQRGAETSNKIYELPIYSFAMVNGNITQLTKLIQYCGDYERIKAIVDEAYNKADEAVNTANSADAKADEAVNTANSADTKANEAISTSNTATSTANQATNDVDRLEVIVDEFVHRVIEGQGTMINKDGVELSNFNVAETPMIGAGAVFDSKGNLKTNEAFDDKDCITLKNIEDILTGKGIPIPMYVDSNTLLVDMDGNVLISYLQIN